MSDAAARARVAEELLRQPASRAGLRAWAAAQKIEDEREDFHAAIAMAMPLLNSDPRLARRISKRLRRLLPRGAATVQIPVCRFEAHALRACGEVAAAAKLYAEVVQQARRAGAADEAARTAIGWIQSLAMIGRLDEARRAARAHRRAIGALDATAAARLDTNLANAWLHAGMAQPAIRLYKRALVDFLRNGQKQAAAHAAFGLARAHRRQGSLQQARRRLDQVRTLLTDQDTPVLAAYVELTHASMDLVSGAEADALDRVQRTRAALAAAGDQRTLLEADLLTASWLAELGSAAAARRAADTALAQARRLGSDLDVARAAMVAARTESALGVGADTAFLLQLASDHLSGSHSSTRLALDLERARQQLLGGDRDAARLRLQRLQRRADRFDRELAVAIRMLRAELALDEGRPRRAIELLNAARRDARGTATALARPRMALGVARAYDRLGDGAAALRWARRSVAELERTLLVWHVSTWRRAGAQSRDELYTEAVELALRHGGRKAADLAADLAARARSPRLIEDLLQRLPAEDRQRLRARWESLRRKLVFDDDSLDPSTRFQSTLLGSAVDLSFDPESSRAPALVRGAWRRRSMHHWRARLGPAELVLFHRGRDRWRAFVIGSQGPTRSIDLPGVDTALERVWKPLRLLLETAARLPRERREPFLQRTRDEADQALAQLRSVLWQPLSLEDGKVYVVPDGPLHDLPLEAIAHAGSGSLVVSRLPHPALVPARPRPRRRSALLLHGQGTGQHSEVAALQRDFADAGFHVRVANRRCALDQLDEPIAALHVAAHGSIRHGDVRLGGISLDGEWLGFEHLPARELRGALLVLASCESGFSARFPGRDMEGWLSAGFAVGAAAMVLTTWKVDDEGASAFSRNFYRHWLSGRSAAEAAARASREGWNQGEHVFRWAAAFCAGA